MNRLTIDIDDDTLEAIAKLGANQNLTPEQGAAYLIDRTLFGQNRRINTPGEDYKPQSVMVMTDDSDDILKHYRCQNCGTIVFEYCGDTKLVMAGRFDRENMMVDGEDISPTTFGRPTVIICQGRVTLSYRNGRDSKKRCGFKYYKLKA